MAKIQEIAVLVGILFVATVLVGRTDCFGNNVKAKREFKERAPCEIIQWDINT